MQVEVKSKISNITNLGKGVLNKFAYLYLLSTQFSLEDAFLFVKIFIFQRALFDNMFKSIPNLNPTDQTLFSENFRWKFS